MGARKQQGRMLEKPSRSARPATAEKASRPGRAARPTASAGDDEGAQELSRRVAENLKHHRRQRGLSLDDLATASGVSRAALSQIETCKTNPTISVLWKVAVGLGIPFAELHGVPRPSAMVLRRGEVEPLRSHDGRFESRPLTPSGASPLLELYELRLLPDAVHASDAHASGTREIVVVLAGLLTISVDGKAHELSQGDSIAFAADRPHSYGNPGPGETLCHNAILYPR